MTTDRSKKSGPRCAECGGEMPPREGNQSFPFCSKRCKAIDLSRWFNEEYAISVTPDQTERSLPDEDDLFEEAQRQRDEEGA